MTDFYYKISSEESAYRIDEPSQQILVYLFSNRMSDLEVIIEKVGDISESEVRVKMKDYLGPDAAGLITQSETTQETLGDDAPPIYYELTEEGEQFVAENKANLSMPADFKESVEDIEAIRTDVIEIRDTMHRVDTEELSESLSTVAHRLESLQDHLSNYD